jgi:hypothetical protein
MSFRWRRAKRVSKEDTGLVFTPDPDDRKAYVWVDGLSIVSYHPKQSAREWAIAALTYSEAKQRLK